MLGADRQREVPGESIVVLRTQNDEGLPVLRSWRFVISATNVASQLAN